VGSRADLEAVAKKKIPCPSWEWKSCPPHRSLVTTPTELKSQNWAAIYIFNNLIKTGEMQRISLYFAQKSYRLHVHMEDEAGETN
jgi:hypothetical protein